MTALDRYSYYFGLAIAIVLGYFLSSLHIERLVIAGITVLQKRLSGKAIKKRTTEEDNKVAGAEHTFSTPSVLSGWTEENLFELERRAIFSKACDLIAEARKLLTGGITDLAFCHSCVQIPETRGLLYLRPCRLCLHYHPREG